MDTLIRSGQKRFVWSGRCIVERGGTVYVAGEVTVILQVGASAVLYLKRCSGATVFAFPKSCVSTRGAGKGSVLIRVTGGRMCTTWEILNGSENENGKAGDGDGVAEKARLRNQGGRA